MLLAGRINELLEQPFKIDGDDVHVTASIGIAQYSRQTVTPDGLMTQADRALYRAKADGRNCFRFADMSFDNERPEREPASPVLKLAAR